jgi:hypothetical protein
MLTLRLWASTLITAHQVFHLDFSSLETVEYGVVDTRESETGHLRPSLPLKLMGLSAPKGDLDFPIVVLRSPTFPSAAKLTS